MSDAYPEGYTEDYEGAGAGAGSPTTAGPDLAAFDGLQLPLPGVLLGFGGGLAPPPADALRLGVGPGLGTGRLGGPTMTDVFADCDGFRLTLGGLGDTGVAESTAALTFDNSGGAYDPENLLGPYVSGGVSLVDLDVPVAVTLTMDGIAYKWFTGLLGSIVPDDQPPRPTVTLNCIDVVAALGRVKLPETVAQWDGDTTGARINRLLDAAGHPTSLRQIDTGRTILGPTILGNTVRQLVEEVVRTEYGLLWADGEGRIWFYDRYKASTAARSTAVQLTISDDGLMSGLVRAKDRDRFANDWQITRNPLPVGLPPAGDDQNTPQNEEEQPVTQQAVDQASIDRYGQETYAEEVGQLLRSDDEALAMAQWGAPLYSTPRMLISQLSADPLHRPGVDWPSFLGLRLLDRVRAVRGYSPAASPVDRQLLAKGIELAVEKGQPGQGATLELAIATDSPGPAEDPNQLRLGGTVGLGSAKLGY